MHGGGGAPAEQAVRRDVEHRHAAQRGRVDVVQLTGGPAVGQEGPLTVRVDEDDDRAGAPAPLGVHLDACVRQLREQAVAERVGPDAAEPAGRDERRGGDRDVRCAAAAGVEDARGGVGAGPHRPVGPDDDVLDEVADDGEAGAHAGTVRRASVALMTAVELFAPSDPAFVAHPYDAYVELRRGPRVQHDERTDTWLVARHADVDALLRDRRLGRSYLHVATHAEMGRPEEPPSHAPFWRVIRSGMLDVEPPDHTRLRRLVSRAFTPRTVERLRGTVQDITDRLVDDALARGEFDLLARDRRAAARDRDRADARRARRPTATCCGRGRPTSAACTSSTRPSRPPPPPCGRARSSPTTSSRCRASAGRARRTTSSRR